MRRHHPMVNGVWPSMTFGKESWWRRLFNKLKSWYKILFGR